MKQTSPPRPQRLGSPPRRLTTAQQQAATAGSALLGAPPSADVTGTSIAVLGCLLTGLMAQGELPSALGHYAAIGTLISLAISVLFDLRHGFRNLIRTDLLALTAFYFLTFFEFLFPQPEFDGMIGTESVRTGIMAVLVGLVGMLVGRHLWRPRQPPLQWLLTREIPSGMLLKLFWASLFVGYLHMLLAVKFDVLAMIDAYTGPRFSQPWARGKYGDWKALVYELGLFIYLIPPLGGIMFARRHRYSIFSLLLVGAAVLFTFFYGFTSGTRNVFASYLVTFLIGFAFASPPGRRTELIAVSVSSMVLMLLATYFMLAFRNVGLKYYLSGNYIPVETERTVFVDYNLFAICRLAEVFPKQVPYLGWEIPVQALIHPIPRALWPGKPEGLTFSIEDALGVEGVTISATFVGEAWMSYGLFAVALMGVGFGMILGWWNHLASSRNSELGILIYSSGFFAAVISMRSLLVLTTALLPTVAAIGLGMLVVKQLAALDRFRSRMLARDTPRALPPPPRTPRPPRGTPSKPAL